MLKNTKKMSQEESYMGDRRITPSYTIQLCKSPITPKKIIKQRLLHCDVMIPNLVHVVISANQPKQRNRKLNELPAPEQVLPLHLGKYSQAKWWNKS
jgi:hypothetical protein